MSGIFLYHVFICMYVYVCIIKYTRSVVTIHSSSSSLKLALQAVQTHTDINAPVSTLIYFNDIGSFKREGSRNHMFHVKGLIVT
jgi:hypothetical protein